MDMFIAASSLILKKRLNELGLLLGGLGALIIAFGAYAMVMGTRRFEGASEEQRRREKISYLAGSLCLAVGFGLQFLSVVIKGPTGS
jgi:uncharacterized membrane protein YidH (DUF202 family)